MLVEEEPPTDFRDCEDPTETILDREMAAQTKLMACIMWPAYVVPHPGIMRPGHVKYVLPLETETRPDGPLPRDFSPYEGLRSHSRQGKDVKQTHVCSFATMDGVKLKIAETLPLPEVQPKCPSEWSEEAWDGRVVYGSTKYYFYTSRHKQNDILAVKLADRRENGKWVYESVDPTVVEEEARKAMGELPMSPPGGGSALLVAK